MRGKIRKILDLSDIETQRLKWVEELAELSQAVAKDKLDNIVEELADVQIIIAQIIEHYGIDEMDVDAIRRAKLTRTIAKLSETKHLPKLKPCRSCGASGELVTLAGSCDYMYRVDCKSCGIKTSLHNDKARAIEAWNG